MHDDAADPNRHPRLRGVVKDQIVIQCAPAWVCGPKTGPAAGSRLVPWKSAAFVATFAQPTSYRPVPKPRRMPVCGLGEERTVLIGSFAASNFLIGLFRELKPHGSPLAPPP